jgi:hypothetical protein
MAVVPICAEVPVDPALTVLRSTLKLAVPPSLSTQVSVSCAALATPAATTALPTRVRINTGPAKRLDTMT